ncbi:MAG TPA: hypothetical protein VG326_02185 [Tepidisphaeraceae bacterium]|jgi:hypothetical protein|nr:hypothetical protein [Tepidisphaeraceae bacterium]
MTHALPSKFTEPDFLCEGCGYTLSGLRAGTNCPECGSSAAISAAALRGPSRWDRPGSGLWGFVLTTCEVLFHPERFYRSLATRYGRERSKWFAIIHQGIVSLIMGSAFYIHITWFLYLTTWYRVQDLIGAVTPGILAYSAAVFVTLAVSTRIAARLTSWEAGYRGLRLPVNVVMRGLDFHAVHYLPVAIVALITVAGWRSLIQWRVLGPTTNLDYLYLISGEVVASAAYLFWTYWIGMRNMMYANA